MSGADTIRGISYQHACVIAASIDVVENPHFGAIRIESSDDIVDFDLLTVDNSPARVAQVKSKIEPYTFASAELIAVIERWAALDEPTVESYELISDAQLSAAAHDAIAVPIDALRDSEQSVSAMEQLRRVGLSVPEELLRRVRFRMRNGDTNAVLDASEYRVLRLLELARHASSDEAVEGVDRLFRAISVRSGEPKIYKRTFTREEIAEILGLSLSFIDAGRRWTPALANTYRSAVLTTPLGPAVYLDLRRSRSEHPALKLSRLSLRDHEQQKNYGADEIVGVFSRCVIVGIPGAGKSTTLELFSYEVAKQGGLPVLVSPPAPYLSGSLGRLIRVTLEHTTNASLVPGAMDIALSDPSCLLLIDGFTERPIDETNQLRRDLLELMSQFPSLRVFVSGRRHEGFRMPGLPILELEGLDDEQRLELGRLLVTDGDSESVVRSVTFGLGELAANPLMFTMALSLRAVGAEVSTRAGLYSAIVEGLWARLPDEGHSELVEEVLARLARRLVDRSQFRASDRAWREMTSAILTSLRVEGELAVGESSAEEIIQSANRAGLIRTVPFTRETVFLHDSFRDYFAARSYLSRLGGPERLTVDHEAALEFVSEDVGVTRELALRAAAENPVLFVKLSRTKRKNIYASDWELARQALSLLLRNHVGSEVALPSSIGLRIHRAPTRTWFALTDTGRTEEVASSMDVLVGREVWRGFSVETLSGPLELARLALLKVVEEAIEGTLIDQPALWFRSFGSGPSELIASVTARAESRKQTLVRTAMRVLPTIADRVLAIAGPLGLRAVIDPPRIEVDGEHLMHYRYEDGPHNVRFANRHSEDRRELLAQTSAESYIERSGEAAAIERLSKAVRVLFGTERD